MRYIYCHPLFDERKCAHRFSYHLKEVLYRDHMELERYDYHGTGEAEGDFCNVTLSSLRQDMAKWIANDPTVVIGTRLGASIALQYALITNNNIARLVLVEPILRGEEYLKHLLRKQHLKDILTGNTDDLRSEDGYTNIEGYKTNPVLLHELSQLDLSQTIQVNTKSPSIFLAFITRSHQCSATNQAFVKAMQKHHSVQFRCLNMLPFWERLPIFDYSELTEQIVGWCHV